MSTSMTTDSTSQAHGSKRKRADEEKGLGVIDVDIPDSHALTSGHSTQPKTYSKATPSTTITAAATTGTASLPLPLPPLRDIPETISVLYDMIRHGGCPHCGSALHCRRIPKDKYPKNCYSYTYICDACHTVFHLQPSPNNDGNCFGVNGTRSSNHCDDNHIFQSKLHLQTLFGNAQSEILHNNMRLDHLRFQLQLKKIVRQINEKRNYISACLGISLGDNNAANTTSGVSRNPALSMTAKARNITKEGEVNEKASDIDDDNDVKTIDKDPFQESIRLLKQEASTMENAMNNLLGLNGGNLSAMFSSLRERDYSRSLEILQHAGVDGCAADTNVDIVNGDPSSESASMLSTESVTSNDKNAKYLLASRVLQEDGEEIEIYEKDMRGNLND